MLCEHCGKLTKNKKFCGRKCFFAAGGPTKKKDNPELTCPMCGKSFKASRPYQQQIRKYCSRYCANQAKRKEKVTQICKHCKKPFKVVPSKKNKIFCSKKCHTKENKKFCVICGETIKKIKGKKIRSKYCSEKCRNHGKVKCDICGKWSKNNIVGWDEVNLCSKKCERILKDKLWYERARHLLRNEYPPEYLNFESLKKKKILSETGEYIRIGILPSIKNNIGNIKEDLYRLREHRMIVYLHTQQPLGEDVIVHHKNGVKTDNRIGNLEVTTRSDHAKTHQDIVGNIISLELENKRLWEKISSYGLTISEIF